MSLPPHLHKKFPGWNILDYVLRIVYCLAPLDTFFFSFLEKKSALFSNLPVAKPQTVS
jgi:hypothetical protein